MTATWRLRGYVVERRLGRGASGDVWRARVAASGEAVALKRIVVADAAQAARAETEAALLSALDHPHLVRLHALVPTDGAAVLVLDLADGGSLADLIGARGRLAPGEVITALAPVAAGLAYLHDQGVVHGDVSAANILFTPAGVPLLADVGVARLTGDDSDAASTPAYVDPAVAAGCVPGPQSDVFMLAGVALHALTGAPPWPAGTGAQALELAAAGVLDDVDERLAAAGVPAQMIPVLARALAVDPHRRGTAADLALDLRHSGEPVAVELAAGRARTGPASDAPVGGGSAPDRAPGPRHAARPVSSETGGRAGAATDPRARPAFDRPSGVPDGSGAAPPTRLAGPRPRPVIPRPRSRGTRRRTVVIVLAAALVALLAAAGTVWASTRHPADGKAAARPPASRFATPGEPSATGPAAASSTASPPRSSPRARSTPDWLVTLRALDALRAQAFASRRPALLARVYAPGPLLTADTALLVRIVPAGCELDGARTAYTAGRIVRRGDRLEVEVTASLPSTRLRCAGRLRGTAPATGPTRLRLELTGTAARARIADQRVVPG
jgi:eukaryotic-like serine/threonine-protein kinase